MIPTRCAGRAVLGWNQVRHHPAGQALHGYDTPLRWREDSRSSGAALCNQLIFPCALHCSRRGRCGSGRPQCGQGHPLYPGAPGGAAVRHHLLERVRAVPTFLIVSFLFTSAVRHVVRCRSHSQQRRVTLHFPACFRRRFYEKADGLVGICRDKNGGHSNVFTLDLTQYGEV